MKDQGEEPPDPLGETRQIESPAEPTTPEKPLTGRPVKVAVTAGLILAALAVGMLILGPTPFFVFAALMILLAQGEFYAAVKRAGYDPALALGVVSGSVLLFGAYFRGEPAISLIVFLTLLFTFIWYMAGEQKGSLVGSISVTMLGVAYVPLLGVFAALMLRRPQDGRGIILVTIGVVAIYDILAYAGGSRFGRHVMAPKISPNKTWEGVGIATVGILLLGTFVAPVLGPWNFQQAFVFAALMCVTAPVGDLIESMIKRDLGIKDMGMIIPGHGGALDRLDSILFSAPAAYLSLVVFGL